MVVHHSQQKKELDNQIFNRFLKPNNYQVIKVFVNKLLILFNNDNELWHQS